MNTSTGIYVRAKRNGAWHNLELEELTAQERKEWMGQFCDRFKLERVIDLLCQVIQQSKQGYHHVD